MQIFKYKDLLLVVLVSEMKLLVISEFLGSCPGAATFPSPAPWCCVWQIHLGLENELGRDQIFLGRHHGPAFLQKKELKCGIQICGSLIFKLSD